jgi:LysR family nitrogen assimilation transcriptional regulator
MVRERHPGIVLYLNETYGTTLSELIMTGRMDLAVLYGGTTAVHGLSFQLLLLEPLFLVGPRTMHQPGEIVALEKSVETELVLPRPYNIVRKMVNDACAGSGLVPNVVAEIESDGTLTAVIAEGLGSTILPDSMARRVVTATGGWRSRIVEPSIEAPLALCQSDQLPLSEPAQAVKDVLVDLAASLPGAMLKAPPRKSARRT